MVWKIMVKKIYRIILHFFTTDHYPQKKNSRNIYINVVGTRYLTFGVNQSSEKYYKKPSHKLTKDQAVWIALTLPSPKIRDPKKLKSHLVERVSSLKKDMKILKKDDRSSCFL